MTRTRLLALLLSTLVAVALSSSPAAADVNCADLGNRTAAQVYSEGRAGDPDRLDADGDHQACERSDPAPNGIWSLLGVLVFLGAALVPHTVAERRSRRRLRSKPSGQPFRQPSRELVRQPIPAPRLLEQRAGSRPAGQRRQLPAATHTGSLSELARALRLVPYNERLALLEWHAAAQQSSPQEVLDALVAEVDDLELQGWALAGYDSPSTVRSMFCACVGGPRNHRLHTDHSGSRSWECATCRRSVSVRS